MQCGHLVRGDSLSVGLVLAGGAAGCGSVGRRCGGGVGGGGAGSAAAAGATSGRRGGLLLFGLLSGELGDAEDELEAAQLDVAAVVEQRCALSARPAASDHAGAASLAAARQLGAALRLAAHHSASWQQTHHRARTLVLLPLLTATDDALDFSHQAAGWRRRGLLREITGVEDVVHRGAVLAVVEQLIMLGILIIEYTGMFPRYVVTMTVVCKAHVHVSTRSYV